jgi:hypothetical protein
MKKQANYFNPKYLQFLIYENARKNFRLLSSYFFLENILFFPKFNQLFFKHNLYTENVLILSFFNYILSFFLLFINIFLIYFLYLIQSILLCSDLRIN